MSEFGMRIKKLRKKKGYTLEHIANNVGTHKGYISGIENGKVNPPSVKFIKLIAEFLETDVHELITIGYIDKAPKPIKSALMQQFASRQALPSSLSLIPLLNTTESGLPKDIDIDCQVKPVVDIMVPFPSPEGRGADFLLMMDDDSMENDKASVSIQKGHYLAAVKTSAPKDGDIVFVIFTKDKQTLSCIRLLENHAKNTLTLRPFNAKYNASTVSIDDVDYMVRIAGCCSNFDHINPSTKSIPH